MKRLSYELPGLFGNNEAAGIKDRLQGRTFFNFHVEYGGVAGNNTIFITSDTENYTQEEFKDFIVSYAFSLLGR